MLRRIAILLFLFILASAQPALAQTPTPSQVIPNSSGKISVGLVNKTAGSTSSVAGQKLTLNIYQGTSQIDSKTAQSDSAGKFAFDGLSTDTTTTYQVVLVYQTASYFSDPLQFAANESEKSLEVDVYDTTQSDSAISMMLAHAILHFANNTLNVKEYYLVANTGDRTYVGQALAANAGNLTTLNFTLPAGAANFQTIYGLDSYNLTAGNQVFSSEPVTPAGTEISYSYTLPANSDSYSFELKMNKQVSRFDFLTSDAGMKISGPGLTSQPPLNISNLSFQDYSMNNIPAGTVITAQLSNLSSASSAPANPSSSTSKSYIYLLFLLIIPLAAAAYFILRRPKPAAVAVGPEKERLLAEIAQLDDDFEDGKIDEKVYQRLRQEKKRQLTGGGD